MTIKRVVFLGLMHEICRFVDIIHVPPRSRQYDTCS